LVTVAVVSVIARAPTATAAPSETCVGDCDGSGRVSIDEVVAMIGIALENAPLDACAAGHVANRTAVRVDEIVASVHHALHGCSGPPPTPTSVPVEHGMCYESSDCFPCDVYPCEPFSATRDFCCYLARGGTFTWCPSDQFDSSSRSCSACEYPCETQ
jgi:hypothetical protein